MTRHAAAFAVLLATFAGGCRKNVEWKVRVEDPKTGKVDEVGSSGPADRPERPAATTPGATGPDASAPEPPAEDVAKARTALLAWLRAELGLDPSAVTIELARADPGTVTFRWGLRDEAASSWAVRVQRGRLGGWAVSEVHDSQVDGFVSPEAWVMDWKRSRARHTMTALRTYATAVESYSIDNNEYPSAQTNVEALLEPTYVRSVAKRDEWGRQFRYSKGATEQTYCISSSGANGRFDADVDPDHAPEHAPGDDLVICTGSFLDAAAD